MMRHTLYFIFLAFCFSVALNAQKSLPVYSFIDHKSNRIIMPRDSSAFTALFNKMDRVAKGDTTMVKVAHMGGSHVQAGIWSNTFISLFQNRYITAGGGYFVFPFKIAKTNGQPFARSFSSGNWRKCRSVGREFCQPLGMNAMNVSTSDTSNYFGVALTPKATCKFVNTVKVYHNFNSSYNIRLFIEDTVNVKKTDVVAEGFTRFDFAMPVDSVCFQLIRKDTLKSDFVLYGFSLENTLAPGFYLAGLGANGASSSSFLRCSELAPQLRTLQADLFILSLGVNDTQSKGFTKDEFIEHYDSLITIIRETCPNAAIMLTTTTDNYIKRKTSNKRSIPAKQAMMELMQARNVAVWDLFGIMGGYRSMTKWYNAGLASKDKVHFNGRGYTLVGHLMFDALMLSYSNSKKP